MSVLKQTFYALLLVFFFIGGALFMDYTQDDPVQQEFNYDYIKNLTVWLDTNANNRANEVKQHVYDWRSVCNPSYELSLPEDRDRLYMTLDYVASAQDYVLNEYDCTEKAELLVILLKEQGFKRVKTKDVFVDCEAWDYSDSYTYEDCKSNNGWHEIVELGAGVYIEATSGKFIMPEDYEKYGIK